MEIVIVILLVFCAYKLHIISKDLEWGTRNIYNEILDIRKQVDRYFGE